MESKAWRNGNPACTAGGAGIRPPGLVPGGGPGGGRTPGGATPGLGMNAGGRTGGLPGGGPGGGRTPGGAMPGRSGGAYSDGKALKQG